MAHVIAVVNGKGGVGKTSLSTHLAALYALAGLRVLLVDFDPQGNTGRDLGFIRAGQSDLGRGIFLALTVGMPLEPLRGVRDRLDVIPGGKHTRAIVGALAAHAQRGEDTATRLREALEPLLDEYDLVIIDCPPIDQTLQVMALTAARWVLIPTTADEAGVDGLGEVAEIFVQVREKANPSLEVLGIVAFRIGSRSRAIYARLRESVASTGLSPDLVFGRWIRSAEGPAQTIRGTGRLAHELEGDLSAASAARLRWLRDRTRDPQNAGPPPDGPAASTSGLAEDFQVLSEELADRMMTT